MWSPGLWQHRLVSNPFMSFALIVLSLERKFLSRVVVETPIEVGQKVADLLGRSLVGSISIQREKPKESTK